MTGKKNRLRLHGHDTRKKQYFNVIGSEKKRIDRNEGNVRCVTCICIPKDEIPEEFFQIVDANST